MKMPLIFDENGDVSVYRSIRDVERNIEVIDVENGEYTAYDATGRLLLLDVSNSHTINIRCAEEEPLHINEATAALQRYLNARMHHLNLENMKLSELFQVIEDNKIEN